MSDQKTTDAAITGLIKTWYDRRLINRLEPKTRLHQLGEKRPIPAASGKTIEFTQTVIRFYKPVSWSKLRQIPNTFPH